MPRNVIFLDRDGTINVDHGYVFKKEDWELIPKVPEALKLFQQAGYALAIITNQSGIAYHYYTTHDMRRLHDFMVEQLRQQGITTPAIAFCPHDRDSTCDCRKPRAGMARHIEEQIGAINYPASWTIGDKVADLGFGQALGTHTALIRSSYWQEERLTSAPELVVDSLYEAAHNIVTL
ncbi:MAG: HAD family hydrolase [Candidatus Andersenbacteria bacterium]